MGFNDKNLYEDFPTIYHLRNKLVNSDEKADIRLVYLAIHHIIKYRGNFLYTGEFSSNGNEGLKEKFECIFSYISPEENLLTDANIEYILNTLKGTKINKLQIVDNLLSKFKVDTDTSKKLKVLFRLIVGYKENIASIFNLSDEKKIRLTEDYDEVEIENLLGENTEVFSYIKDISSWFTLQDILQGNKYVSKAFIDKFDKYKSDLRMLKDQYKKHLKSEYLKMFRLDDEKNYKAYNEGNSKCSYEDLIKRIKNDLNEAVDNPEKTKILEKIENEDFLIKLNTRLNSVIPFQLHKIELEKILENQSKYYSTIQENKEKIISILKFKIPYYVGPLHRDENSKYAWSIRKEGMEHVSIKPWNFDDVIDKETTAEKFIRRMTNKCTYLPEEDVIPKNSLLYSEYCLLNELNNISYNGDKLPQELKKLAIEKIFKKTISVNDKSFKEFLKTELNMNINEVRGYQKEDEFASSLKSYIDFKKIFGKVDSTNLEMIEELILWITIFKDKDILEKKIRDKYSLLIDDNQIKQIIKLKYKGWSRLSKKLLTDLKYTNEKCEKNSIMDILRNTGYNFMQIITDKEFNFDKLIEESQIKLLHPKINETFYKENVATIFGSPALKRGIWQSLKLVDEIVEKMGNDPENIYIEFAREDGEKVRTSSRINRIKESLKNLYSEFSEEQDKHLLAHLNNEKDINERLYLYYTQNGKCMYTGTSLNIDELDKYQIDHIIPQCKIKDDSIDNTVLVISKENQRKTDNTLEDSIVKEMGNYWEKLKNSKLISQEKYYKLINNHESKKRQEGFIKRQLVETRQITKYVANILQNIFGDTKIFSIKAELTTEMKNKFNRYKIRNLNDLHHAHDAYICATLGYYISNRFPKIVKEFDFAAYLKDFKKSTEKDLNQNNRNKFGFVVGNFDKKHVDKDTGECWDAEKEIANMLRNLECRDVYVTKKLEEQTGNFYDQNILSVEKAKSTSNPITIKKGLDPLKYGSYNGLQISYCTLFSYKDNNKLKYQIVGIPVLYRDSIKNEEQLKEFIAITYDITNPVILIRKIYKNQLIKKENKLYSLVSDSEIKINKQLYLDDKDIKILFEVLTKETKVDEKEILNIYDTLKSKIKEFYFEKIGNDLELYRNNFIKLDNLDKIKTLKLLMVLIGGKSIDLKIIGGKSGQGRENGKTMDDKWLKDVILINQSITGIYEKRINIDELANLTNN